MISLRIGYFLIFLHWSSSIKNEIKSNQTSDNSHFRASKIPNVISSCLLSPLFPSSLSPPPPSSPLYLPETTTATGVGTRDAISVTSRRTQDKTSSLAAVTSHEPGPRVTLVWHGADPRFDPLMVRVAPGVTWCPLWEAVFILSWLFTFMVSTWVWFHMN